MKGRSLRIDYLKGIAIIAVVLYHIGVLPYGFLGVDIFFVISGYLMMKEIISSIERDGYSYTQYVFKRIIRLWPIVLIVGIFSLGLGFCLMLPDDLENLSESVIASNVFANNILAAITTKNYWNVTNTYKPLMHTWYLGVLMQAYIVFPAIFFIIHKITQGNKKIMKYSMVVLSVISLILYLIPSIDDAWKFYYLPFRTYEILSGALLVFIPKTEKLENQKIAKGLEITCLILLMCALCMKNIEINNQIKLLVVVSISNLLLLIFSQTDEKESSILKPLAIIGKMSFSIYLIHQVVIAIMYYSVTDSITIKTGICCFGVISILALVVYYFIEQPLNRFAHDKGNIKYIIVVSIIAFLGSTCISGLIYLRSGVVRDIPELGISKENIHRGIHSEYCDRPYDWDVDFKNNETVNILVIGNSFGRDWANILSESSIAEEIEISYIFPYSDEYIFERKNRIDEADFVFCTISETNDSEITDFLRKIIPSEKLYVVGTKNFGSSNGIIYSNRKKENYFEQTVKINPAYITCNEDAKKKYGEHYIDMITPVQMDNGTIQVFTDDNHYISQDCRHLTEKGAIYYSKILNLSFIVE